MREASSSRGRQSSLGYIRLSTDEQVDSGAGPAAQRAALEAEAQRVRPPLATWDSLVLPDAELDLLHQISSQVAHRFQVYQQWGFDQRMNRGLGISALFAGDSGNGKSMAAEVLASDLGLDLYRIDLSAVVSKYIGETEKNLRGLFDAAQGGGVILFFDEADALFGKRSEVKDAHDRYANIETNYLLQRMEQFSGLAILATNMRSALDRAFARRLRFIVTFPFPTVAHRARMWSLAFPPHVANGLDHDRLARIDLNGASIANSALNAAFAAAAADRENVLMDDVLRAARNELRKLDRPVNEAHFRLPAEVQT
jgi:SpoVK/Ycf46/Vps4 family AAA+-type ATPase